MRFDFQTALLQGAHGSQKLFPFNLTGAIIIDQIKDPIHELVIFYCQPRNAALECVFVNAMGSR